MTLLTVNQHSCTLELVPCRNKSNRFVRIQIHCKSNRRILVLVLCSDFGSEETHDFVDCQSAQLQVGIGPVPKHVHPLS